MRFVLFTVLLSILLPAFATAGVPCEFFSSWIDTPTRVVVISPAGTAPSLAEQGVVIDVELLDCLMEPIASFPLQDIWVSDIGNGELSVCQAGSMADANTDGDGRTTISGPISGGGHTENGVMVWAGGIPMESGALLLDFVSPDLDGDLDVDLADFASFGGDFGMSGVMRSDFVPDGIVNLADFAVFGQHYGESCP